MGAKAILNNISLECNTGDVLALFGRNGSGKSTLLKLLFGSLKFQTGTIAFNGKLIKSNIKEKIMAFSHQQVFLPNSAKVRNVIPLYYPDGEDQNKIFYAPGINKIEKQKIGALSLGERKYLQFLLVINLPHPFVLLDEPFSMIDPLYKDLIKNSIIEASENNKGIILTDHYYEDVFKVTKQCFLIKEGDIQSIESLTELAESGYIPERQS